MCDVGVEEEGRGGRFVVVVPTLEPEVGALQETLESLLHQRAVLYGRASLRVRVIAQGLSDAATRYLESLPSDMVSVEVDQGQGMYAAVSQGLKAGGGDFYAWLGVSDTLEEQAFDLVLENAPASSDEIWWCTGFIVGRRKDGAIVRVNLPPGYRSRFFERGIYATQLPTIQQESTFWSDSLNKAIPFDRLSSFKLAGDYFLWRTFTSMTPPIVIEAALGSFRWHGDNRSAQWDLYIKEVDSMVRMARWSDKVLARFELGVWALPNRWKKRLNPHGIRRFSWPEGPWT